MSSIPGGPINTGDFRADLGEGMKAYNIEAVERGLIGTLIAPVVEVDETTADIGIYPLDDMLRDHDTERAMGGDYAEGGMELDKFIYSTEDQGFTINLDERFIRAYKRRFPQLEQHAAELARQIVMTRYEKRVITKATDSSVLNGDLTDTPDGAAWSDRENSVPVDDMSIWTEQFLLNAGVEATSYAIDFKTFNNLKNNAQILARISANGAGDKIKASDVTAAMIAQTLGIDELLVSKRMVNVAGRKQPRNLQFLWPSGKGLLFHRGVSPNNPYEFNFMNTFHWGEDGSTMGGVIEQGGRWENRSKKIRSRMDTDEKIKYKELGFLTTGLV